MSDGPTIKVEIEFTTSTWTDVSAWVRMREGLTITRGRPDAFGVISPGQCSLALRNDDGRFTPGLTTGAYSPNVVPGKQIKVSVQVDTDWHVRFTGRIESWGVPLNNPSGVTAVCQVQAVDNLGYASRVLKTSAAEILEDAGAVAYWPLTDSGPVGFAELGSQPSMKVEQVGTEGTLGWGGGTGLPIDGATPVIMADNISTTAGQRLAAWLKLPGSAFTVGFWANPADGGSSVMLELSKGGQRIQLTYTPGATATYTLTERDRDGAVVSLVSTGSVLGDRLEMISIPGTSGGSLLMRSASGGVTRSSNLEGYGTCTLRIGGSAVGGTVAYPGTIFGHLFVLPSALTVAQMDALAARLGASGADSVVGRIQEVTNWAGDDATITSLGADPDVLTVPPEGMTAIDVANLYAESTGSRFLVNRAGSPVWVDRTYRPDAVAVPAAWVRPDMVWQADTAGYLSECVMTMQDGTIETYARSSPLREQSVTVQDVSGDLDTALHIAEWVVNTTTQDARIPSATINLMTLPAATRLADQATVLGLDVASRLVLSDLPPQVPDDQAMVVEGYEERIGYDDWSITYNLSPDVIGRVLILDDATSLLDSTIWDI